MPLQWAKTSSAVHQLFVSDACDVSDDVLARVHNLRLTSNAAALALYRNRWCSL